MFIKDFVSSELSEVEIASLLEIAIVANMIMLESIMGSLSKPKTIEEANILVKGYIEKLPTYPDASKVTELNNTSLNTSKITEVFGKAIDRNKPLINNSNQDSEAYWHNVLEAMALYIFDRIVVLSSDELNSFLKFDFFIKNDRWELVIKKEGESVADIKLIYCKVNGGVININATLGFVNYCYFISKRNLKEKHKSNTLTNLSRRKIKDSKHLDLLLANETTGHQVALLVITAIERSRELSTSDLKLEGIAKKNFILNNYYKSLENLQYAGEDHVLDSISNYLNNSAKTLVKDNIDSILKYHSNTDKKLWDCAETIALAGIYEHEIRVNPEGDSYLLTIKHREDEWLFVFSKKNDCLALVKVTLNSIDISDIHHKMTLTSGIKNYGIDLIEEATKFNVC